MKSNFESHSSEESRKEAMPRSDEDQSEPVAEVQEVPTETPPSNKDIANIIIGDKTIEEDDLPGSTPLLH